MPSVQCRVILITLKTRIFTFIHKVSRFLTRCRQLKISFIHWTFFVGTRGIRFIRHYPSYHHYFNDCGQASFIKVFRFNKSNVMLWGIVETNNEALLDRIHKKRKLRTNSNVPILMDWDHHWLWLHFFTVWTTHFSSRNL